MKNINKEDKMIKYADDKNFKELLADGFSVVDFYTETCAPCKVFAGILEGISEQNPDLKIVKVNVTKYPVLAIENDISAVPTILFVQDGKVLDRELGLMDEDEVMEKVSMYSE